MSTSTAHAERTPPAASPAELFSLAGKTALLTGGTRGIGAACALALARAGASVVLVVRPLSSPSSAPPAPSSAPSGAEHPSLAPLLALGQTHASQKYSIVEADLADMKSVKEVFPKALQKAGGTIDVLVNCGGIQRRHPSTEFPEEDWDEVGSSSSLNSPNITTTGAS